MGCTQSVNELNEPLLTYTTNIGNTERLSTDASFVKAASSNVKVDTIRLDLGDLSSIPGVIKQIDELAPEIEVVFFNAAVVKFTEHALSAPVEELETDFRVRIFITLQLCYDTTPEERETRGKKD